MAFIIKEVKKVSVGTAAVEEPVDCRAFMLVNNSAATVYIKEKAGDGKDATADNGFALQPGQLVQNVMTAEKLSMVASEDGAEVRVLYGTEG